MNTKFVLLCVFLAILLAGCNLASPKNTPTAILTVAPTLGFNEPSAIQPISPTPPIITTTSPPVPLSTNQAVLDRAAQVIFALKHQDMTTLSGYIHPQLGLRFSPYAAVKDTDQVFPADKVANFLIDSKVYPWGAYDGSGEPIDLGFPAYYSQFIYDVDYANSPQMALNHRLGVSTTIDNRAEFYPGAMIVEYYFPGFEPQYQGMDWRSLRLVFIEDNNNWYLVGIIHDQWTT